MKIIIAPDSFKESLTALEVAEAIEAGFRKIYPTADYIKIPMADGGEGTVQSLVDALNGRMIDVNVTAPLGNQTNAFFGLSGDGQTAIIEMATASGLHLVPPERRNPLKTTSFGTGELIKAALDLGIKKCILGIGGSATNDGGAGMLQALGAKLLDKNGRQIDVGGEHLAAMTKIDASGLDPRLYHVDFEVACDVDNPLCGEKGASAVFGLQKGATLEQVKQLDQGLYHFSEVVARDLGIHIREQGGAGAAGGMGGGLMVLPRVELKAGVQIVIETVNLTEHIKHADLVITGEGRMDGQSIYGKTPIGVAKTAKTFNKPVIALVGCLGEDYEVVYDQGIDAVFPILRQINTLEHTLKNGYANLLSTAQNVARLIRLSK